MKWKWNKNSPFLVFLYISMWFSYLASIRFYTFYYRKFSSIFITILSFCLNIYQSYNNTYIYLKNCLHTCPDTFYIDSASKSCVTALNCPSGSYANNQTRSCVLACRDGTYADVTTKMCIEVCYGGKYGDSVTGLCSSSCSTGLLKNNDTYTCVG